MRIRFGEFVFDSDVRELTARGEPRRLSTKAFILLQGLLTAAPRALSKEELYRQVWGDTHVEEANLPNLISEIRAALGETRSSARFIKTIHGFGYAFSGELGFESRFDIAGHARMDRVATLRWRQHEFPHAAGENVIGRGSEAHVTIDSGAVSRRHARLLLGPDFATIEDLGSKNGTFVQDIRIAGPTSVQSGDEIRLGVVCLIFRSSERAASTMTGMSE